MIDIHLPMRMKRIPR